MQIIILLVIIIFIFWFLKKYKVNKITDIVHSVLSTENKFAGYKKKFSLMNNSESALFFELRRQLPPNYYIFPNMRLADIVESINGNGFYKRRNKILPKHIDFIVCDPNFKPVVAIELNGGSHNKIDRIEKDEEKRKILEGAQLPLVTIEVGDDFIESVLKIKNYL